MVGRSRSSVPSVEPERRETFTAVVDTHFDRSFPAGGIRFGRTVGTPGVEYCFACGLCHGHCRTMSSDAVQQYRRGKQNKKQKKKKTEKNQTILTQQKQYRNDVA